MLGWELWHRGGGWWRQCHWTSILVRIIKLQNLYMHANLNTNWGNVPDMVSYPGTVISLNKHDCSCNNIISVKYTHAADRLYVLTSTGHALGHEGWINNVYIEKVDFYDSQQRNTIRTETIAHFISCIRQARGINHDIKNAWTYDGRSKSPYTILFFLEKGVDHLYICRKFSLPLDEEVLKTEKKRK